MAVIGPPELGEIPPFGREKVTEGLIFRHWAIFNPRVRLSPIHKSHSDAANPITNSDLNSYSEVQNPTS